MTTPWLYWSMRFIGSQDTACIASSGCIYNQIYGIAHPNHDYAIVDFLLRYRLSWLPLNRITEAHPVFTGKSWNLPRHYRTGLFAMITAQTTDSNLQSALNGIARRVAQFQSCRVWPTNCTAWSLWFWVWLFSMFRWNIECSGSISTKTELHPHINGFRCRKKVKAVVITSSPAPMLQQLMQMQRVGAWSHAYRMLNARLFSRFLFKGLHIWANIKAQFSIVSASPRSTSSLISAYWAFRFPSVSCFVAFYLSVDAIFCVSTMKMFLFIA